ncbi:MAG: DUF411 domain-containing protein [Cohaesibacter sp.]|nr:DUF411 domain-containing protein [Cohaesibacter sp.]
MLTRKTLLAASFSLTLIGFAIPTAQAENTAMTVYKSPYCGCCSSWAKALEQLGYKVETKDIEDLEWAKKQFNIPEDLHSCHTAIVDNYVVEGHVPPQALQKLLKERPQIRGIAVPAMPEGSLGMGYDPKAQYSVYAFGHKDGKAPQVYYQAGTQ